MDWSLIIFAVVILLFAWRGFRSGFIKSLGRVFIMLAGYAAAILYSGALSSWIEMQFGWQGVVAFIGTSLTLFLAAGLAMMLIFALLRRYLFPGDDISTTSALGGGFIGALVGVLLAIAIVWSFAFVRDIRSSDTTKSTASEHSSVVETLANRLTGSAVSAAMNAGTVSPEVARVSGALAAAPAEAMQRIQRLTKSPEFLALMQDPRNHDVLDSGNPELVQQLPAFRAVAVNPDLLALAEMSGLADDDLEAGLARQLTDIWARAQQVRNEPRVQAILADPGFQAALDSNNPVDLLTNPQLLELADIIFADEATTATAGQSTADTSVATADQSTAGTSAANPPKEPTEIYQWTDSSGRIHYSDQKPE
jgi:uncharacterized membrane protein required for colicin V production